MLNLKLTQCSLVIKYLKEHKHITPAKMIGNIYSGQMFGSELGRTCRQLYKEKKVNKIRGERFMTFYIK